MQIFMQSFQPTSPLTSYSAPPQNIQRRPDSLQPSLQSSYLHLPTPKDSTLSKPHESETFKVIEKYFSLVWWWNIFPDYNETGDWISQESVWNFSKKLWEIWIQFSRRRREASVTDLWQFRWIQIPVPREIQFNIPENFHQNSIPACSAEHQHQSEHIIQEADELNEGWNWVLKKFPRILWSNIVLWCYDKGSILFIGCIWP